MHVGQRIARARSTYLKLRGTTELLDGCARGRAFYLGDADD
jgi:hypothetical protein